MTIVSHSHRFILLRTRKTAGTSVEASLVRFAGRRDWLSVTRDVGRLDHPFTRSANVTTRWVPQEVRIKRLIGRRVSAFPAWNLHMHATASEVKQVVGPEVWSSYLKISIERNPWDRMISLWRWRTRRSPVPLTTFLTAVESGDPDLVAKHHAENWSNWPIYAIGDTVEADVVLQQDDLQSGLRQALRRVDIDWDGELPQYKAEVRGDHETTSLTLDEVERIGALFHREILHFGYAPPAG